MAKRRQVIEVPGLVHGAPIPAAMKIGNMVFTGGIMGTDPATGQMPPEPEKQAELIFQHMRTIMEKAGGSTDDIAHVTVFLKDMQYRNAVNAEWVKMFPNEDDRPTRHALKYDLAGAMLIQCEMIGVLS